MGELGVRARWGLALVGVGLLVMAVLLFLNPTEVRAFPPQCAEPSCVTVVEESNSTTSLVLAAGGVLLLVLGINGRQIVGLKLGGAEATMSDAQKDDAAKRAVATDSRSPDTEAEQDATEDDQLSPAPGEGTASVLQAGDVELVRVEPAQVPAVVIADLIGSGVPVKSSSDLAWGARAIGKGNHPWYVQLRSGVTYKVAYGGRGKAGPSVSEVQS